MPINARDKPASDDLVLEQVEALLSELTLTEKFALCAGNSPWKTRAIPRLGIRRLKMTDGPRGVAFHSSWARGTAFPSGISLGASWDTELARDCGTAMALEARAADCQMLLGPAFNICRTPLNGRTFEYFTEDPHLNGRLAVAQVQGIQSQGVAACIKHFAANNQETTRMRHSVEVSQRALREIYLPAFEAAVKEADPWGLMAAYNAVNGIAACENRELLHDILRQEFNYQGLVVSDWFAVRRTSSSEACIKGGLTLEMPGKGSRYRVKNLRTAFDAGKFTEQDLDNNLRWLLRVMIKTDCIGSGPRPPLPTVDHSSHTQLARRAAEDGMVLLKNDGATLPIDTRRIKKIAIVGPRAKKRNCLPMWGGSSGVWPRHEVTPFKGIRARLQHEGIELVRKPADADLVILCIGLSHRPGMDSEVMDRKSMDLPENQVRQIEKTVARNANTVAVLISGSPLTMDWANSVPAIVQAWYPGMEGGNAIARILFGDVSPSGKLPVTFPRKLTDVACHNSTRTYPGQDLKTWYDEGVFVGYRHFDKRQIEPLFPFGHGLSYTSFEYSDLELSHTTIGDDKPLTISAQIKNTGDRPGAEIVQLYLRDIQASQARPVKELKGFCKLVLQPGESKPVHFELSKRDLSFYNEHEARWQAEAGKFELLLAASSRDVRLKTIFNYQPHDTA
jgi:beta-glucosidase